MSPWSLGPGYNAYSLPWKRPSENTVVGEGGSQPNIPMMLFEKILVDANDNPPIAIFGTFDMIVEPQHTHTHTYTKFLGQPKECDHTT